MLCPLWGGSTTSACLLAEPPHCWWQTEHPLLPCFRFAERFEDTAWRLFKPSVITELQAKSRKTTIRSRRNFTSLSGYAITSLLLLCGDIASHPGPSSLSLDGSQKSSVKCLVLNARSLKSFHKTTTENKTISNLQRFQDLVYADDSDVVCVNETWLNEEISNSELLHDGYIIYRKDRDTRRAGCERVFTIFRWATTATRDRVGRTDNSFRSEDPILLLLSSPPFRPELGGFI